MTAAVVTGTPRLKSAADAALRSAAGLWLAAALAGQWAFFSYIAAFYGPSTFSGHFEAWRRNTMLIKGYVPGDAAGNLTFGAHALLAGIIAFGGALQLIPQIRRRAPAFHRWNGRLFAATASGLAVSGLYLLWVRHANSSLAGSLAITFNAALILAFVALAWRTARARQFEAHRRWAMRLYLVSNAQWFTRVGVFAWIIVQGGRPAGLDAFFSAWQWGCYLAPLAVLELYLRSQDSARQGARLAMAAGLVAATVLMAVGSFGFTLFAQHLVSGAALPKL